MLTTNKRDPQIACCCQFIDAHVLRIFLFILILAKGEKASMNEENQCYSWLKVCLKNCTKRGFSQRIIELFKVLYLKMEDK
jgi:hypothetical protein